MPRVHLICTALSLLAPALAMLLPKPAAATEPNETFGQSTVLASGVMSITDELTLIPGPEPDTLLGSRGLFGNIDQTDDDGSPKGNGFASALFGVATNSGTVSFSITGAFDDGFFGSHAETGEYVAEVTVYDFFGDEVDFFVFEESLSPGDVDDFSFNDFQYINGSYDVVIDNTVGTQADVDFFTFTDLPPGADFIAETLDPDLNGIDTLLGWFDDSGALLDSDDDGDGSNLQSTLEGVVPASGRLTFAVTGTGDTLFEQSHGESGTYALEVTVEGGTLLGDSNGDGIVNTLDINPFVLALTDEKQYAIDFPAVDFLSANDANTDGQVNTLDINPFVTLLTSGRGSVTTPEPATAALLAPAILLGVQQRRTPSASFEQ